MFSFTFSYTLKNIKYSDFLKTPIEEFNIFYRISYKISYNIEDISKNYVQFSVSPITKNKIYIYFSFNNDERSTTSLLNSELKNTFLYINKDFLKTQTNEDNYFYITLASYSECYSFDFNIKEIDNIELNINDAYNYFIPDDKNVKNTFSIKYNEENIENDILSIWATGSENIKMNVNCDGNMLKIKDFPNGKICIINKNNFCKINNTIIEISCNDNDLITVGNRLNSKTEYTPNSKEINGLLSEENNPCYDFSINTVSKMYLNVIAYEKLIDIEVKNKSNMSIINKISVNDISSFIELPGENNINLLVCFSLTKNNLVSEVPFTFQVIDPKSKNDYKNLYSLQINSFFSELDTISLNENERYFQTITLDSNIKYSIANNDNCNLLNINFLIFSGDISINFNINNDYQIENNLSGNKNYFIIKKVSSTEVSNEILFDIKANLASYYTVDYKCIENDKKLFSNLNDGISYLETIDPSIGKKTIKIKNTNVYNKNNFMTNFKSLNCKINVTRIINNNSHNIDFNNYYGQDIFIRNSENEDDFDSGEYDYLIQIIKMDNVTAFEQNWCMVYISSIQENNLNEENQKHIIISEGQINKIKLSENFKTIQYLYPHLKNDGYISMNFNIETNSKINVQIFLNNTKLTEFDFSKSRYYIIEENIIKSENYCPNIDKRPDQPCNIIIKLTLDSNFYNDEPIITFNIKSKENIPIFFQKSMLRQDIIVGNFYQYFYTEIGKREEGEIIINFNRGNGNVFSKIVQKNNFNGWSNFILPNEKDTLIYNHYSKRILFTEKDSENCEVGCFLILKIMHDLNDENFNKENIAYPITILMHSNDANVREVKENMRTFVNIPINEYIIGNTEPNNNDILEDYYTFFIPENYDELIFEFKTEVCSMHINIGSEPAKIKNNHFDFYTLGIDSIYKINKSQIQKILNYSSEQSIKNVELNIAISAEYLNGIYTSIYSFRIRGVKKNEIELIQLISDQKTLCKIESNFGNCYFLLTYDRKIDNNNNLFFYAIEEVGVNFNYYVNIIEKIIIDNGNQEKIKENIPNKNSAEFKSDKTKGNFLYIPYSKLNNLNENSTYILLNIEMNATNKKNNETTTVNLIHTLYTYKDIVIPDSTTSQLFMINEKNIKFKFLTEGYNIRIHIVSITGSANIFWENEKLENQKKYYLNNEWDSLDLTIGNNITNIPLLQINSIKNNENFGFYMYYEIESDEENYNKLDYGRATEFIFKNTDFPFIFYSKLLDNEHVVDFILKLNDLNKNENNYLSYDDFSIEGVVTDEELIYSKKSNKDINPPDKNKISGFYDPISKEGRIQFTPEKIKKFENDGKILYLYIVINKSKNNKYIFVNNITFDCTILPSNQEGYFPPSQKYNQAKIPKNQKGYLRYELKRINIENKYIRIEFATNSNKINYAIIQHNIYNNNDVNYYNNNTKFEQKIVSGGKSLLIIKFENNDIDSIYLSIFNNQNDEHFNEEEQLSNFIFKYELSKRIENFNTISLKNNQIVSKYNNGILKLKIPSLINVKLQTINYYFKLILDTETIDDEKLTTISQIESKANKLYMMSFICNGEEKEIELNDIKNEKIYNLVVMAEVVNEKNSEFFCFNQIYDATEHEDKAKTDDKTAFKVIIIISIVIIIILGLVFFFVFYTMKTSNKHLMEQINKLSFSQNDQEGLIADE